MKTQINTLVHGSGRIAGTCSEIRNAVAEKVIAENPEGMHVRLFDELVIMCADWSDSGLSVDYYGDVWFAKTIRRICDMNGWDYAEQTIDAINAGKAIATLHINGDMTCEMLIYHHRSEGSEWKLSKTLRVDESDIIIS